MIVLSLDTTCGFFSIAIYKFKTCLDYYIEDDFNSPAEKLMPKIKQCLTDAKLTIKDIEFIACTKGPGSFTGIRIGISAVQGLALGLDIPVIGMTSLETIAYSNTGDSVIAIDAGRNQFYTQHFLNGFENSEITICDKDVFLSNDAINKIICDPINKLNLPDANKIALLALYKIENNLFAAQDLNPVYINSPNIKK